MASNNKLLTGSTRPSGIECWDTAGYSDIRLEVQNLVVEQNLVEEQNLVVEQNPVRLGVQNLVRLEDYNPET